MRTACGRYAEVVLITGADRSRDARQELATSAVSAPASAPAPVPPPASAPAPGPVPMPVPEPAPASNPNPAAPQQTTARPTPVLAPIQGPLKLEGQYLGDLSGAVDAQGDGVVDADRLLELLKPLLSPQLFAELEARTAGQERIAMDDLRGEDFSLTFDTFALTFNAVLSPTARARREVSFGYSEAINPATFDQPARFAAGANITLAQQYSYRTDEFADLQSGIDAFATLGGFEGVTLTTGADYDASAEDKWKRREIRLSKDIFSSAIRLTAGEFSPPVESFQGTRRFLGISAARAYSTIRPFQNIHPSGRREFILDREAFVEVEVNGIVVERLRLDPGPYSLRDFPYAQGPNTVRLLVDQDTGRSEIAVFDLFGGAGLLDVGVLDFGVSAGVLEEGGELEYGSTPAVTGFMRKGLSDVLTVGANAQYADSRAQLGTIATWGGPFGLLQFSGAASYNGDTGNTGVIGAVDYLYETVLLEEVDARFVATMEATSRHFQNAFAQGALNSERWSAAAQGVFRYGPYSLNVGSSYSKGRDLQPDLAEWSLGLSRSFERFSLNLNLGQREYSNDLPTENRVGVSLTTRFGGRWSAGARYDNQTDLREITLSRSPTGQLGDISGTLRLAEDDNQQAVAGDIRYINNRFDVQILANRFVANQPGGPTTEESLWRVSSFVGYADGAFGIGRQSQEGFVIASRHPTLGGSEVTLSDGGGQAIARTGWFGPALAPINRAYGVNRFVVAVTPLPTGYDIGRGVLSGFPGFGSGYHMVVGSDASRTVIGVLTGADGPMSLVSGTIEAIDPRSPVEPRLFFTNRGGRFVGDGMSPGRYRMLVGGVAVAEFVISEEDEGVVNVGEIRASPR